MAMFYTRTVDGQVRVTMFETFGTAMGSPISVTVADLVMEDIEERALTSFPSRPLFWKRYVDDTCTALRPDQLEAFHKHLNSIEPSINFTYKWRKIESCPFWTF